MINKYLQDFPVAAEIEIIQSLGCTSASFVARQVLEVFGADLDVS